MIHQGKLHSDETIVANDRLSIVLKPLMLLIDFKITVADIVNQKKKHPEFGQFLVKISLSAFQNKMAVVDSVNGNSNNFQRNKGDRVDYPSSGVTLSDIWEFFIFYK